jgi:hypothetical protein
MTDKNYRWWTEGSAQWSMDYVFPGVPDEEHAAVFDLLGEPETELDSAKGDHPYGTYLLPFYLYRKTKSAAFVSNAWLNCEDDYALEAVDRAIGGFDEVWPGFVEYNFNDEKFDFYKQWDRVQGTAELQGNFPVVAQLAGKLDDADPIEVKLPRLSATYKRYKFTDETVRTVAFWNGVTFKLDLEERSDEPFGVIYHSEDASADQKKGARVQALIKMAGQDWRKEDWTDVPYVAFCRDLFEERIEELVIIISNSEFEDRDRVLKTQGGLPVLWTSNMSCWKWKGTVRYDDGEGVTINTDVTWTRTSAAAPPFVPYTAAGTEKWASTGVSCEGSGSLPIIPGISSLVSFNFVPSQSTYRRSYYGAGVDTREVETTCPASEGSGPYPFDLTLSAWLFHPSWPDPQGSAPGARFLRVNDDGRVMDGTFKIPGTKDTWTWHFEAERQP